MLCSLTRRIITVAPQTLPEPDNKESFEADAVEDWFEARRLRLSFNFQACYWLTRYMYVIVINLYSTFKSSNSVRIWVSWDKWSHRSIYDPMYISEKWEALGLASLQSEDTLKAKDNHQRTFISPSSEFIPQIAPTNTLSKFASTITRVSKPFTSCRSPSQDIQSTIPAPSSLPFSPLFDSHPSLPHHWSQISHPILFYLHPFPYRETRCLNNFLDVVYLFPSPISVRQKISWLWHWEVLSLDTCILVPSCHHARIPLKRVDGLMIFS